MSKIAPTFTVDLPETEELRKRYGNSPRDAFGGVGRVYGPHITEVEPMTTVYLHGKLEERARYDIPVFLEGNMERVPEQDALYVDHRTNEIVECKILLYIRNFHGHTYPYGLVVEKDEVEEVKDYILSQGQFTEI